MWELQIFSNSVSDFSGRRVNKVSLLVFALSANTIGNLLSHVCVLLCLHQSWERSGVLWEVLSFWCLKSFSSFTGCVSRIWWVLHHCIFLNVPFFSIVKYFIKASFSFENGTLLWSRVGTHVANDFKLICFFNAAARRCCSSWRCTCVHSRNRPHRSIARRSLHCYWPWLQTKGEFQSEAAPFAEAIH